MLLDPARRKQIADAAVRRLGPFQIEVVAERFAALYAELIEEART